MPTKKLSFNILTHALWGLFTLTLFSGIFLLVYYVPTFAQAFSSVLRVNEQIPFGWMIRRAHGAGATFLLLFFMLHLLRVFYAGDYKNRRGSLWAFEVLLVFGALWANFTGFFLPLSQGAFWGTASSFSALSTLPWVGSSLVEFLRGGRELGGIALTRFLSMHIGAAAVIALLLFAHDRMAAPRRAEEQGLPGRGNLWVLGLVSILLFAGITFQPSWFADPLREAANPTVSPEGIFSPWYFLFLQEALSFCNSTYPILSVILMGLVLALLVSLPYFDRNPEKKLLQRPVCLAVGAALLMGGVYFTLVGMAGAHYGEKVVLPIQNLTPSEVRGAQVYARKNCAYCHQVLGHQGRREGPDMAVVRQRNRSPEWIQRFIWNARLEQPGTTMPKYEMPLEDLEALGAYLLSLDPTQRGFQAVDREILLNYGAPAGSWEKGFK
jgi:quinol-cytochrome oxidoreductase complex cytochrome b subunit